MIEIERDQLRQSVEQQYGGVALLVQSVPVKEISEGETAWEGTVHVFDLEGTTRSTRAYAWSLPQSGNTKRRFVTVLHLGGVTGPEEAVREILAAEKKAGR